MRAIHSLRAVVCGLSIAGSVSAATVNFQQGLDNAYVLNYQGTSDTSFNAHPSEGYGNGNAGGADFFWSNQTTTWEERKAILRFDLSALAGQNLQVDSATLILRPITGGSPDNVQVALHAISAANAGWVQGTNTGPGPVASPGSATWNEKGHGVTPWAGSAGLNTPGVDYDPVPAATGVYDPASSDPDDFTLPASLVQSWIDSPATNAGLVMLTDNNATNGYYRFADYFSSEVTNSSLRPTLSLEVSEIPEPGSLALAGLAVFGLVRRRNR